MNNILAWPMEVRLTVVFLVGVCLGGLVNWAIYRLAWFARPISPWTMPDPAAPPRRFSDRVPIFGWLGLRREAELHGAGFWVRPMLLELFCGIGLACLYWWEVCAAGLLPAGLLRPFPQELLLVLHAQFAVHTILFAFMLAGSMIDVDEKTIPDAITLPGTLLGLLAAVALPQSRLPDVVPLVNDQMGLGFLHLTAPNPWPDCMAGFPAVWSLVLGLGCWWLWCMAVMPRTWYARHGWRRALALCWSRVKRLPSTYRMLRLAVVGSIAIAWVWFQGSTGWESLLSATVGMAAGGGLIWAVRIIGTAALGREAMGFGDVTLMAMIGAFLGWQPCLVIFFLAPVAGLIIGILRLIILRDKEIPYGPFLCLATAALVVFWDAIWHYVWGVFALGWFVPIVMLACLAMMAAMLSAWRLLLGALRKTHT